MAINKVQYLSSTGLKTLIDLTGVTVTSESLLKGFTAYNAAGELIVGVLEPKEFSRLPAQYQEVEWIQADADIGAYLNLGLKFDYKSQIEMSLWFFSEMQGNVSYPFGAAENSGTLRCCISAPYGDKIYCYGSDGSNYRAVSIHIDWDAENHISVTHQPGTLSCINFNNGDAITNTDQATYSMTSYLYLFAQNYDGKPRFGHIRRIGYFKYYDRSDTLACSLVPCYRKSDEAIGMYDTVREIFLTNVGTGSFTKGPDVGEYVPIDNWVKYSINPDGTIYNDGLGYKVGYRVRSGGAEATNDASLCVGYIPVKNDDVIRIARCDFGSSAGAANAINVYNSSFENLGQVVCNSTIGYGILANTTYGNFSTAVVEESEGVYKWTVPPIGYGEISYIRVSAHTDDGENLIITVNKEITI